MSSIDSHVHFLISKVAAPDWSELRFFVDAARDDGLDFICVTEHLDAVHYEGLVLGIFSDLKLGGRMIGPGVLQLDNGLVLTSGAEVALKGGGDVGVHAVPDVLLRLTRKKGAYLLNELLDSLQRSSSDAAVVAHHYYWANKSFEGIQTNAHRLDGIELPAKDLANATLYVELAERLSLPLIGASDAHTWVQAGSCRSIAAGVDSEGFSHASLKMLIRSGALMATPSPQAAERVRISTVLRQQMECRLTA